MKRGGKAELRYVSSGNRPGLCQGSTLSREMACAALRAPYPVCSNPSRIVPLDTLSKPSVLLMVEDNADDVFFLQRILKKAELGCSAVVMPDGERAIRYLTERLESPELLPEVVLLDLNLPRVNGFELMAWVRAQPSLAAMRLVVMTSSADERDVQKAYSSGAGAYLLKYPSVEEFRRVMRSLGGVNGGANDAPPGAAAALG
jgi:CheY-like chemotaxis protein